MATTETSFSQELIEMILRSETITPEQQQSYIDRISKGEFTEEMQQELATIFENEVRRLDGKIGTIADAISAHETMYEEEWKQIEPDMKRIAEEDKAEAVQAVAEYQGECNKAEQEADGSVEGAVREGEASEADAIRESLKQKPSESEQA